MMLTPERHHTNPNSGRAFETKNSSNNSKNQAILMALLAPFCAQADDLAYNQCLINEVTGQNSSATAEQIRSKCKSDSVNNSSEIATGRNSAFGYRVSSEREIAHNPFAIIPHRMNYILPATYTTKINTGAYSFNGWDAELKNIEAKYQISFKTPLLSDSLLFEGDGLFVGFTLKSWWQLYSSDLSKPFRENNYTPELMFSTPLSFIPTSGTPWLVLGLEHESNGRDQNLSRSWNRLYANFIYEKDNWMIAVKPWWRLPEGKKTTPQSPKGDDNPDISKYYGHYEIMSAYNWDKYSLSLLARENFATHKGYLELGLTFPLWDHLRGYVQYVNGYGESLIDYNVNQQRIGIGVVLTDLI